jgi:hypothetical protein
VEPDQIDKIFKKLGSVDDKIWPGIPYYPFFIPLLFFDFPFRFLLLILLKASVLSLMPKILTFQKNFQMT